MFIVNSAKMLPYSEFTEHFLCIASSGTSCHVDQALQLHDGLLSRIQSGPILPAERAAQGPDGRVHKQLHRHDQG